MLICREHEIPSRTPLDIRANFPAQRCPDSPALQHQRDLGRISALQPHKSPVAAGLLTRDTTFLEQGDPTTGLREVVGRVAPDDPATDDGDIMLRCTETAHPRTRMNSLLSKPGSSSATGVKAGMWVNRCSGVSRSLIRGFPPLSALRLDGLALASMMTLGIPHPQGLPSGSASRHARSISQSQPPIKGF